MSDFKPNHICKNKNCNKGIDGGRKHYYACDFCTRTKSWRSVACSYECYEEYVNQVIEARSKGKNISTIPERTDMTESEVNDLMNTPVEKVLEDTKEQLKDYIDIDNNINIEEAVESINIEIESTQLPRKRKKNNKIVNGFNF